MKLKLSEEQRQKLHRLGQKHYSREITSSTSVHYKQKTNVSKKIPLYNSTINSSDNFHDMDLTLREQALGNTLDYLFEGMVKGDGSKCEAARKLLEVIASDVSTKFNVEYVQKFDKALSIYNAIYSNGSPKEDCRKTKHILFDINR